MFTMLVVGLCSTGPLEIECIHRNFRQSFISGRPPDPTAGPTCT